MKLTIRFSIVMSVILLGAAWMATGCNDQGGNTHSGDAPDYMNNLEFTESALELEDGAISTDDGAPAFGEEGIAAEFGDDETTDVDNVIDKDSEVTEAEQTRDAYYLIILWGKIPPMMDMTDATDFSGKIYTTENAAIKVKRVLRFEKHDETADMILPRTSRSLVEINSMIYGANDGLILKIIPLKDAASDGDVTVTYETELITLTFQLTELKKLQAMYDVDQSGNKVLVTAFMTGANDCPQGLLKGRWKRINEKGGVFAGKWISATGIVRGHMKGIWGERKNGEKVFFGHYRSINGKFKGLIKGHYEPVEGKDGGVFKGIYVNREGKVKGVINGKYFAHEGEKKGGFMAGKFHELCGELCPKDESGNVDGVDVPPGDCAKPEPLAPCNETDVNDCPEPTLPPDANWCCQADGVITVLESEETCDGISTKSPEEAKMACGKPE